MSKLAWYWHRLRAMSASEIAMHARKKFRQFADARRERDWASVKLASSGAFPKLPAREPAPEILRAALKRDAEDILAGRWKAFGHLNLQVDDPPKWHCDYLVGRELATTASAFKLNHRALPGGADIKLIWELSRWSQLVRLAQAAYVRDDEHAGRKCVRWLEDWVNHNPPYRGWNWTSALESGMRLIQFTWIDALLSERAEAWGFDAELETLRQEILPPHAWFTWRHQSFGSSANNHLLGELAGLIVATARWPALAQWGASLGEVQARWERAVLAQFAEDGGNKEQALNYHLFSWELCWQAQAALLTAGRTVSRTVEERLRLAARFFLDVQVPSEPWDYGDSDNAVVTPIFADETRSVSEWHEWFRQPQASPSVDYWWREVRRGQEWCGPPSASRMPGLIHYEQTGQAIWKATDWTVRFDVSPLGYLKTAAHGHLDALQLSIWRNGVAFIVDPGTGCYYADQRLRDWLASRSAHNPPCPARLEWPKRLGPFLWQEPHAWPALGVERKELSAGVCLPDQMLDREFIPLAEGRGFDVVDGCFWNNRAATDGDMLPFTVRWQLAPGARVERLADRRLRVTRRGVVMEIRVSDDWEKVFCVTDPSQRAEADPDHEFAGTVSPAFRQTEWAPYLKLTARPDGKPRVFRTTFLVATTGGDAPESDDD